MRKHQHPTLLALAAVHPAVRIHLLCCRQILTPRKLYILHGKVAVFPSNAISLEEATPRFDDAKGTIHLDVSALLFGLSAALASMRMPQTEPSAELQQRHQSRV
jgi:hypothetical protein